jgi:hypothetical protein
MLRRMGNLNRKLARKRGAALLLALVILALGSIVVTPVLIYVSSGLNNTRNVYEKNTDQVYSADAGIEDAQWRIKYTKLEDLNAPYVDYDYSSTWNYDLNGARQVNGKDIHVEISNEWIPSNVDISAMDSTQLDAIVQDNKLAVTGSATPLAQVSDYAIKITYDSPETFHVSSIGVWLPPGYTYAGPSDLENPLNKPGYPASCLASPYITQWAGNQSVVWNFPSAPAFTDFPAWMEPVSNPKVLTVHFKYSQNAAGPPFNAPMAVAWITTTDGGNYGFPFAWDADIKVFHIASTSDPSGNPTSVESYVAKSELRHLKSAIYGDYYATGNSNLSAPSSNEDFRNVPHDPSTASVTGANIPSNAEVAAAYLYWSGWKDEGSIPAPKLSENCQNLTTNGWQSSLDWTGDSTEGNPANSYKGTHTDLGDRNLTSKELDLSGGGATVSWDQEVHSGPATQTRSPAGNADGAGTWTANPSSLALFDTVNETTADEDSTYMGFASGSSGNTGWLSLSGPTTGAWLNPTAQAATTGGDGNGFETSPTSAYANGGGAASNANNGNGTSGDRHLYYNYNTNVPAGNDIVGIEVEMDWWVDSTFNTTSSLSAELSWDGGASWTAAKTDNNDSTSTSHTVVLGSASDNWGHNWTAAELSNANFRVRLTCNSTSTNRDFSLDWVPVRITYGGEDDSADTGGDGNGFEVSPTNAYANGGGYASNIDNGNGTGGDRHRFFGYDTSTVPAGSNIAGIEVELDWWVDSTSGTNSLSAELSWDGGDSWTAAKTDSNDSTSTSHSVVLGSASDNWGHSWTTAELSNANFVVRLTCNSTSTSRDFSLDWVPVRITYSNSGYQYFTSSPFTAIPLTSTVSGVTVSVRARETSSGTSELRPAIKVSDTLCNTVASSNNLGSSYQTYSYNFTTNPATHAPWTPAEINAGAIQAFGVYIGQSNVPIRVTTVSIAVGYTLPITGSDGLDFSFYDGSAWSAPYPAFRGDIGTSSINFSYGVPSDYAKAHFKIRFTLVGFNFAGQKVNIDNIKVNILPPDTSVVFKIDDTQVYFDGDGEPHDGSTPLTATKSRSLRNYISGDPSGYSYSAFCDVTDLVRRYSQAQHNPAPEPDNYPGYAVYSVGDIGVSVPPHNPSNQYQIAYAGWSIVIIYTSPDNLGHQLYLYDDFICSNNDYGGVNVDFDRDGIPGGKISGFVIPKQVTQAVITLGLLSGGAGYESAPAVVFTGGGGNDAAAMAQIDPDTGQVNKITITNGGSGYTSPPTISFKGGGPGGADAPNPAMATCTVGSELNAAKLTAFVGEGDLQYYDDYVKVTGASGVSAKLWDGYAGTNNSKSSPNNVFNSRSLGLTTNNGIDIDTLGIDPTANPAQYIPWSSNILKPGDTSAQIDMYTEVDVWNLIYIIFSFRSAVTTGGSLGYLIH